MKITARKLTMDSKIYAVGVNGENTLNIWNIQGLKESWKACEIEINFHNFCLIVDLDAESFIGSQGSKFYFNIEDAEAALKPSWQSIMTIGDVLKISNGNRMSISEYSKYTQAIEAKNIINDGWKPDWSDTSESKWYINSEYIIKSRFVYTTFYKILGYEFYFETVEKAKHFYKYFGHLLES
jgi:hypothetical protein